MKKTYFTRRDDEGKIFDKGFCIEASNEKDTKKMDAVAMYLENIYGENFTYIDGVIRVHCAADLRGIDLRVFKSMFNDDYRAAKNHAAEYKEETAEPAASIEPEPAAKDEKPAKKVRRRNSQMVKIYKNNPYYDSFRKNVCRYSFHRSYAALRQAKKRGGDAKKQGKYSIVLRYLTPFYKVA